MNLSNFNLRKLRQRDIALAIIVLTVILGVLWYFYLYQPAQGRIAELNTQIEGLNADITTGEIARDNIQSLQDELTRLALERQAFLEELPLESEVSTLIDQLRVGAEAAGVDFNSVSQSGSGNEQIQDVRSLGFSVSTNGSYLNTMNFLDILESLRRFTKIRQVGLAVQDDGVNDPSLNATYDFAVYVYTGQETVDDIELDNTSAGLEQ